MRKLVFWCDRCGAEIATGKTTLDLTGLETRDLEWRSDTEKRCYDLCLICWGYVLDLLKPVQKS